MSGDRHTLIALNPGHFHAALTLRQSHPRLSDDVYVYADDGPDLEGFVAIVESFNARAAQPTRWRLNITRGPDHLDRLIADRAGDLVVAAGRNDTKMAAIARLHAAGFAVLGDKPWLIDEAALPQLAEATAGPPLAMDIMTERHAIETKLLKALVADTALFGGFRTEGPKPAIEIRGVHHLYKIVNGAPLIRPAWYFDTAVQGRGIVDVTTHQVDLALLLVGEGTPLRYDHDVALESAERWPTDVPLGLFSKITGLQGFPEALAADVTDGVLAYDCNGKIGFRLRSVPVEIESRWDLAVPDGGGDTQRVVARGMLCEVVAENGPATGFTARLQIRHASGTVPKALERLIETLQSLVPGLAARDAPDGCELVIPDRLVTGHEAHFAAVLDQFLGYVDAGVWPESLIPNMVTKYTLLARAQAMSRGFA